MMDLEKLASAATAAWRAGCDEKDGPARIEGIIRRFTERAVMEAREEQRKADLELACEAVCGNCRQGLPLRANGMHDALGGQVCDAKPIRRAFAEPL